LEFVVGSHVYLHISPVKGMKRFVLNGKLAPCYIGPFPNLERCGPVAYKLDLPPALAGVYDIFHVSQHKKCLKAPSDVVLPQVTPLEAHLYPEHLIKIWKTIKFYKVQCSNHSEEEATWESEDFLCSRHPDFLPPQ
jgi:hypothetical protein